MFSAIILNRNSEWHAEWGRWVRVIMVFLFFALTGCSRFSGTSALPAETLAVMPDWPHEQSDLGPDPDTYFGRLPNGVRYILKENRTPKDRVSMHLFLQCGSLYERTGEEGLAHFLEHMQFDGSEHFPPGELVKYFQRIGMRFGPDANAHTGFDRTVYDIVLPKGDSRSITEGLQVLKDYAQGALLLPEQVEKEKKVVLAEKRTRDSAGYRTLQASLKFQLPEMLLADRLPIGKEESIRRFDADMLRSFYDRWYRPERMILLMVGQFDTAQVRRLIETKFGDLQPRAAAESPPDFGSFSHEDIRIFYHYERESGATSVHIETAELRDLPPDTAAYQRSELLKTLADRMVQKRLDAMVQTGDGFLNAARIDSGYYAQRIRYAEITADCRPEDWAEALAAIEQSLRQALHLGFTPLELERAKSVFHADLQRDLNEENTRQSNFLAGKLIAGLNDFRVFQSPRQRMDLLGPMLDKITLAEVHRAFKDTWSASHRLVRVTGNADLQSGAETAEDIILSVYQNSGHLKVREPQDLDRRSFPYLPEPASVAAVKEQTPHQDLGVTEVVFDNGVRLVLKPTDFKENEVIAALSFGTGRSSQPLERPGLALLTEETAAESGFGAMDRTILENALAGRLAKISLDVREEQFVVQGQSSTAELPLLFQLLYTAIQDPGYREEALQVAFRQLEQKYSSLTHSVDGVMQLQGARFLAGGDNRFGWPSWPEMTGLTLDQIKDWFGHQLASAPLELAVVGDFEPEEVIELTARYLGALPKREARMSGVDRPGPRFPKGERLQLNAATEIDKALVAVVYLTDDFWDIERTRRLNLLSNVFSEKLRVRVREKLGAAYSPHAYHHAYRAYPGYGLFHAILLVNPRQVDVVVKEVQDIAEQLATQGVSADELRRALDPTLSQIKDLRQSNYYWLNSVLVGSSRHPEQFSWARSIESDYAGISVEEIDALARQYMDNRKAAVITIMPE